MYEKIIVPLDGSKLGESALPYVQDLVSKLSPEVKVDVTLLQVLSPLHPRTVSGYAVPDVTYTQNQTEEMKKKAIDYLTATGEALRSKGVTVTAKVAVGDASEEIAKAAKEIDVDLIAMSTHGRSGIGRLAFGSVADKVLRHSGKIPVLMVRASGQAQKS
jgi:nucleotide-binding universal stress UspA family protein